MRVAMIVLTVLVSIVMVSSLLIPIVSDVSKGSTVDVIVVDGQSNAEDWASFYSEINLRYHDEPVQDLYYYGSPTTTVHYSDSEEVRSTYAVQPMYANGEWVIGGYAPPLCNGYAAKNGHDVFYVNIGCSGRSIDVLQPSGAVGTWGFNVLDDAIAAISDRYDHLNMIGWIWAQGEADKTMAVDTYIAEFEEIQSKFASYGLDHCYIIHTREYYGGNATIAQAQIAETDSDVTMTCMFTDTFTEADGDLRYDDPIHYSQRGRIKIANELVDIIPNKVVSDNGPYGSLLGIVPVVVIAGIIVSIVSMLYIRRE